MLLLSTVPSNVIGHLVSPYRYLRNVDVILVTRGKVRDVPSFVRVVGLPLKTVGTLGAWNVPRRVSLFLNSISYLALGLCASVVEVTRHRCRVVHARFLFPEGVVGLLTSMITGAQLVVTATGEDANIYLNSSLGRFLVTRMAKRGTVTAVSVPIQTRLGSLGIKSTFIPTYVDTDEFAFVPLAEKESLIVFIGTLDEVKRPDLLVEAINDLRDFLTKSGITTHILGEGHLRPSLVRRIRDLHLDGLIALEGYVTVPQVVNYLARARVYVSCSTREGLSAALLEAMASGSVVIASRIPGNEAVVSDRETALLFNGDKSTLANAIMDAFLASGLCSILTQNARQTVESTYSVKATASVLARVYGLEVE